MPQDTAQATEQKALWEIFDRYREYVKHQYDLTNHRTTWFVTMNAFLFTTFGFTIQKKLEVIGGLREELACPQKTVQVCRIIEQTDAFMLTLCAVGTISSLVAFFLLQSARRPIKALEIKWEQLIGIRNVPPEQVAARLRDTHMILLVGGLSKDAAHWGRWLTLSFPI